MKKQQNPTSRQRKEIQAAGLDPANWFIERDTSCEMVLVHRHTATVRKIIKGS